MNKWLIALVLGGGFYLATSREVRKLKELDVKLQKIKKIDISSGSIVIDLEAKVVNESAISVEVERLDYTVKIGGHKINSGAVDTPFVLSPKTSVIVPVRASSNLSLSLISLLASIFDKESAVKTFVKITLRGGKTLNFEI